MSTGPVDGPGFTQVRIGSGLAMVHGGTFALLHADFGARVDRLWSIALGNDGIDVLLEELSSSGLRGLADFVLAEREERGTRLVVRGDAVAEVFGDGDSVTVDADDAGTWVDRIVTDATGFELSLGPVDRAEPTYRFSSGFLPAASIRWSTVAAPETFGARLDLDDLPVADEPPPPEPEPPRPSKQTPSSHDTMIAGDELVDEPAVAPTDGHDPTGDDDGYDFDALFGRTVAKSVQGAAVTITDATDDEPVDDAPSASRAVDPPPEPPHPGEPVAPVPTGLIDMVPASPAGPPSGSSTQLGDHDGHTMSIAQLRALRGGSAPPTATPRATSDATVLAVACSCGAPNPPHHTTCSRCGAALTGDPVLVSRPNMGLLVMSSGEVVELDRPAVIGRKPKVEGTLSGEVPQLVKLDAGQGLSRSHMMVRLEQWQVLVEDLGSANGTVVTLPNRDPRRLHAGDPILVEHGTSIDLGGEVTASVELAWR